ncbi:YhgE/Pip domain-containing protein [Gordonia alkanivorans]|uniref:YhgE/Pip domain-containing protein n=2 Tax=Gordonia alkanivorans TaxID=84096 RepID=UPI0004B5220A|nr:YhgE/Pip domain-containing protein [Gordonia alkanivorans]MDH3009145.1 YhgE/Pip domain-containing protein [Gordonia alkanivorans]MDH3012968.1 YhgE/Pip domain-containing protein [Gordonia alkanivorans]MDH3015115.1 YhgE/Pip domain-containing protein [Gordonia alkanivorans]MDH3024168.1 YhgE/Pip domain-containing protein [Gordonia alkanivorans]MDH3040075.1 YhgE/Pip domain-containing protein [Gordonia alkanivorans]
MFAAFSPGSDIKRYYRGRMPRLALVVIMLMPLLYGAMYLWAFWNPFAAADKIPVALVNEDTGAVVEGQKLDAGSQVAAGLIESKQLDLHEVSAAEAADGVAHGKYYFSITLPADFSKAIASPTSDKPRSAPLVFTYNDANNYLATIIGQDAAQQVVNKVSAQVGAQTFEIVLNEVGDLTPKLTEAADGANELAAGLKTADSGAQELASGLGQLDSALIKATDPLLNALGADQTGLSSAEVNAAADRLARNAGAASNELTTAANQQSQASKGLDSVIAQLSSSPDPTMRSLANALSPAQQFLRTSGLGPDANNQLTQLNNDANLLSQQLGNPNSPLRLGLTLVENGGLRDDILAARGAANELKSGSAELSSGLGELSAGADELASGLEEGVKAIPSWTNQEKTEIAKTLAQPVELQEDYTHEAPTFGTGFAPFFMSLALFVGGIITWMLLTPLQSRPIVQGFSSLRVVLASYTPAFAIGFIQATVLYTVVTFAVGLRAEYPIATFLYLLLVVATFMAMIQMFNAVFDVAVGRVVTLAFLMVQLVSAGGIYPVPTTATPFQYIHYVDPMTYTVEGLRQLTVGGIDYRLWLAIGVLSGITLGCLLISSWAARRNRQYTMDRLYPPVEV